MTSRLAGLAVALGAGLAVGGCVVAEQDATKTSTTMIATRWRDCLTAPLRVSGQHGWTRHTDEVALPRHSLRRS